MSETNESKEQVENQGQASAESIESQPPNKDSRMWAMLCHLLAIFTYFIAPLVIWMIKKDEDEFVNDQGKEALNWQIMIALAFVAATILFCAAPVLYPVIGVCNLVFCIIASVKANEGQKYRYPMPFRLIK